MSPLKILVIALVGGALVFSLSKVVNALLNPPVDEQAEWDRVKELYARARHEEDEA